MYPIGAFSKLSHLSARMLRHYDALGLLRPARVDPETGYRYYDSAQLVRLEAIRRLRDYGFSLAEVPELLELEQGELALRLRQSGPTQSAYLGCEFNYEHMDMEAQMEVEGADPGIRTVPGGLYAATSHRGSYETLQYAYNAVCGWLGEHPEYRVCGPALERYLKDETSGAPPEEYETGILFPVEKQPDPC